MIFFARCAIGACAGLTLFVCGCDTFGAAQKIRDYSPAGIAPGTATIVLSTGLAAGCRARNDLLYLFPANASYFDDPVASFKLDSLLPDSDFKDHRGYIYNATVPPGEYYFALYRKGTPSYFKGLVVPKYDVSVSAGEVLYVGEFYIQTQSSCDYMTNTSFRDEEERDVPLLTTMNPSLSVTAIVKRIPSHSGSAPTSP